MSIAELKSKFSRKEYRYSHRSDEIQLMKKYYDESHDSHSNFLYAFLCFIYDGINKIEDVKKRMRILFISSTKQVIVGDEDIEEYFLSAKRKGLISLNHNHTISLTKEGKKLVEVSYYNNLYTSYYMGIFFSEKTVLFGTALCLIILSILKISTGLQLGSQAMFTEGLENFTDLIKIAIVGLIGLKLKKDKFASVIIILLMMFTGVTLIWAGIGALIEPISIFPTTQAYIIGFVSIALNAGLAFLKSIVGRTSGNLSLLSDSKDSVLNVRLSVGVLIGLTFAIFKIYFMDAVIGIIIAVLVFWEGIDLLRELTAKEEDFDITSIKVVADSLYDNRLTAYILGSIRRESLTIEQLLNNFEQGLSFGRLYYEGFADFFYNKLGAKIAVKHLNKLFEGKYIEKIDNKLFLTAKGLKTFYRVKEKEFRERSQNIIVGSKFKLRHLYCIILFVLFVFLIIISPQINLWMTGF